MGGTPVMPTHHPCLLDKPAVIVSHTAEIPFGHIILRVLPSVAVPFTVSLFVAVHTASAAHILSHLVAAIAFIEVVVRYDKVFSPYEHSLDVFADSYPLDGVNSSSILDRILSSLVSCSS